MMLQVGRRGRWGGGAWAPPGEAAGHRPGWGWRARRGRGREPFPPSVSGAAGCWRSVGTGHRWGGGSCVGMGCRAHPSGAQRGREPWIRLGPAREVGLGPGSGAPAPPGPGARRRGAAGAGAGWRLHSNGLRSRHTLAPLAPGRRREPGTRGAGGGPIQVPAAQRSRSAWAVWVLSPALTLRPGPAQMVGSQARGAAGSARGAPCAGGGARPALCPAGPRAPGPESRAGAGAGGVDRQVLGEEGGDTPGRGLGTRAQPGGPERGFLACAWRDFVSACLCPVCVCAEAPAAPPVCTFCVRSEGCLGKCPGWRGLRRTPRG